MEEVFFWRKYLGHWARSEMVVKVWHLTQLAFLEEIPLWHLWATVLQGAYGCGAGALGHS